MPKFVSLKIPVAAREQLDNIRENLSRRLGAPMSAAQAVGAAIDTLHRIQNDPDLAITSKKTLDEVTHRITDDVNERIATAVAAAVTDLTGIKAIAERSPSGRAFTVKAGDKKIIFADNAVDFATADVRPQ